MEMFKILLLTVAVIAPVTSQNATDEPIIAIPQPEIIPNPAHKVLYSTEQVSLQCSVSESIPDLQYEWFKDSSPLNPTNDKSIITVNAGGTYECRAKKGSSASDNSNPYSFTLQAIPTPKLTLEPKLTEIYPSEKVTLSCEIQGSSDTWSYRWFKNNEALGESKSLIEIKSATMDSSGDYTCEGFLTSRVTTEKSTALTLKVKETPIPKLTVSSAWTEFFPNEQITMQCGFESSSDGWSFDWTKNGKTIKTNPTLTITAKNSSDSGQYACKGKLNGRSVITQQSNVFQLNVTGTPIPKLTVSSAWTEFFPNEQITMQCGFGSSSDGWSFEWTKNGETIKTNPTLTITAKSSSDSGQYACKGNLNGRSVITQQSNVFQLNVTETPIPKLTADPTWKEFFPNEQITMQCGFESSSDGWSFEWTKNGTQINTNPTLTITAISSSNSGQYACKGKLNGRSVITQQSNVFQLNITDIPVPKLTANPTWTEFFPNEQITMQCGFGSSTDGWSFEWTKNGTQINTNPTPTLTITATSSSDSGQYACKGKLNGRSVTTQQSNLFQLNVRDLLPNPRLTQTPDFQVIYTGEKLTFNCTFEVQSSGWEYLFFRDSKQINTDTSANSFSVTSAKVQDGGKYCCQTKRRTFTSDRSDERTVIVKDPPSVKVVSDWTDAFPGETVTLQCVIQDISENWTYNWYKNGNIVSSVPDTQINGNTLSISVKPDQSGTYKYVCYAELEGRSVMTGKSSLHLLKVYGSKPTISLDQDPKYPEIYTGEQVRLTCSIKEQTSPQWTYQWKKDNTVPDNSGSQTYTISSATMLHKGSYTCHISRNGVTFSSEPKKLTIIEPPQPTVSKEPQWELFYPTEKVTLTCLIDEKPDDWNYEWYRNGNKLSKDNDISLSGKTLTINSAKSSHTGNYTCQAKHKQRLPVTTKETEALHLNILGSTPEPTIRPEPSFEFFYTDEQVQLTCSMPGPAWEYHWYKDSKPTKTSANENYIINSASVHDTGEYHCKAKRRAFSIQSKGQKVQVKALSDTSLNLVTELSDIIAGNILTLNCEVLDDKTWNYTWFENNQELNESSSTLKVKSTEETIKNEFKCRGKRTERPLYSYWSEGFMANNILFKRKILLAISGCFVCCIVILIIGCIVLKVTRKPEKKEPVRDNLFISLADSKNQATSPLMEYIDSKPLEKESEEKEELQLDSISVTHVDGVIKGEDSPSAETNGLTSFKAS
ncbi:hemicentin-1 isoform X2 [Misgurnus anguillicaudatus]|uniref:hemicentin-1 isoform X2 n=1 Tax=Misgurnus anguillicaudatus TaxID=75329 RepID=UPI003CCF849E